MKSDLIAARIGAVSDEDPCEIAKSPVVRMAINSPIVHRLLFEQLSHRIRFIFAFKPPTRLTLKTRKALDIT